MAKVIRCHFWDWVVKRQQLLSHKPALRLSFAHPDRSQLPPRELPYAEAHVAGNWGWPHWATASKELRASVQQPRKNRIRPTTTGVSSEVDYLSVEPSDKTAAPAKPLLQSFERLWGRGTQASRVWISQKWSHRNSGAINACFKSLSLGAICYTAIDNYYKVHYKSKRY